MADFAKALKQGFEAVEVVWSARLEIEDVFERLSAAVLEITDGKVRIAFRKRFPGQSDLDHEASAVRDGVMGKTLARVMLSERGYPVSVRSEGTNAAYVAGNREELEAALAELVADVRIAERIKSLAADPSDKG